MHRQRPHVVYLAAVLIGALIIAFARPTTAANNASKDGWLEDEAPDITQNQQPARDDHDLADRIIAGNSAPLLKGGITYCLPRGTPIKLKLATVPTFGMKMLNRDMDGKLLPAKLNQEITAKTTEDIFVDDNKVIPQGTVFHGAVTHIFPPKRNGRPGSLALTFDSFQTPDGKRFAFKVEANNTRQSTNKTKLKSLGRDAAWAAGGAITGALIAYQLFGLQETIAMHGYNIAGGAAAGALLGVATAILKHGPEAVLEPGDDLNMEIDTDLLMPAATNPTARAPQLNLPGLSMKILHCKVIKDGLDGYQLKVEADIDNNTNRRLQSIDLFIEDDNGSRFPVVADAEEDKTDMLFTIDPYAKQTIKCDFAVEYPKLKRKLIWLDHHSRRVLFEQRLP